MTITGTEAYEAMRAHHRILDEQLTTHVAAVSWAVAAGRPHEAALAGLVAYLAEQVLPHAAADVLLPALLARRDSDLAALLAEMHHRTEQVG
jgi:hypothetical protein